ncbi:hypothetical protein [Oricola sp.]|uniref:hypothetical protein n=1 Tax=Oricola sp. TaxID=1979950 RepID=UPI003BAC2B98
MKKTLFWTLCVLLASITASQAKEPVAFVVQSPRDANDAAKELCTAAGYKKWATKRFAGGSEVAVICTAPQAKEPVAFVVQSPRDANDAAKELCTAAEYKKWATKRFAGDSEVAVICFD